MCLEFDTILEQCMDSSFSDPNSSNNVFGLMSLMIYSIEENLAIEMGQNTGLLNEREAVTSPACVEA